MAAFYNVPISSVVKIKVIEPSLTLTADELALKEIPVSAIIESQDVNPFTSEWSAMEGPCTGPPRAGDSTEPCLHPRTGGLRTEPMFIFLEVLQLKLCA